MARGARCFPKEEFNHSVFCFLALGFDSFLGGAGLFPRTEVIVVCPFEGDGTSSLAISAAKSSAVLASIAAYISAVIKILTGGF